MAVNKKTSRKKRDRRQVQKGQVHIKASFNNTIITFTDMKGNALSWSSSGKNGFKSSKKSTPFAAQQVMEDAAKSALEHGLQSVEVYVKGPGNGRDSAIRAIEACGINITKIQDVSPIAHNACRPPKKKRI